MVRFLGKKAFHESSSPIFTNLLSIVRLCRVVIYSRCIVHDASYFIQKYEELPHKSKLALKNIREGRLVDDVMALGRLLTWFKFDGAVYEYGDVVI